MATYRELLAQKRELDERIEAARAEAANQALASVRATIAEYGFTPDEVFGKPRREKADKADKAADNEGKAGKGRKGNSKRERANLDLFGDTAENA
ncbi:H-NS family nucleoid-associated regulatory protein [Paraburkholderia unamae]|uniref:H-NS histone family protein n=2 Tax=Paraburkholderia unamae TaxID=219649 RepID=A0ABX5KAV6_9BURK|nr:H-NS family nucleoid-associated regulatory protein [Paraburkholderia unamae]PVX72442.1 H-NS histone family protein [Paraburkholderia unamae]